MEEIATSAHKKRFPIWSSLFLAVLAIILAPLLFGFFLWMIPHLELPYHHPIYQKFGIKKPEIIGFQPYWLLGKTTTNYAPYITDTTYFGLTMSGDGTIVKQVNKNETEPGWNNFKSQKLKDRLTQDNQNDLTTSLLVAAMTESELQKLISDPEGHANTFIKEVTPLIKDNGYTDLNLDIESFNFASPSAQLAMTQFLQSIKKGLDQNQLGTLTIELTASSLFHPLLTDPVAVGKLADRVVVMTYDFHYAGSELAGPVAPVGGAGTVSEIDVTTTIEQALAVIPREKLILGIPLYGYEWETLSEEPGSPVIPGTGKTATSARAEELHASCTDCQKNIDGSSLEPYLILPPNETSHIQQIYYENADSLQKKLDLAKKYHLGGVALWALGYEGKDILEPLKVYKQTYYWQTFPGGTTSYWAQYFPQ